MKLYNIPTVKGRACSLRPHSGIRPNVRGKGIYAPTSSTAQTDPTPSSNLIQVQPTRQVDMTHIGRALAQINELKKPRKVRL